jgi:DNA replication and repair protein RecF
MFLKNLQLKNFRNYDELNLNFNNNTILIIGDNGQGKTNLLESIYYISSGKSHRTNVQDEIITWGSDYAVLRASFGYEYLNNKEGEHLIELELRKGGNYKIKIDGVHYHRKSDFISILPAVIFSPDDLRIIKSGPSNRRDFLDGILEKVHSDFFTLKTHYQKVLNQRNSLFKSMTNEVNLKNNLSLDTWNESLVNCGCKIIECRMRLLEDFRYDFVKFMNSFYPDIKAEIKYIFSWNRKISGDNNFLYSRYKNSVNESSTLADTIGEKSVSDDSFINLKEKFILKLKENLRKDLIYKTTIIGPHRDDFQVLVNGRDIRSFGSQGQQRIASICLKLCEINILKEKNKTNPVLLLDDVLSELDRDRERLLVEVLKNNKFQTFITTANLDIFEKLDLSSAENFFIKGNKIFPQ